MKKYVSTSLINCLLSTMYQARTPKLQAAAALAAGGPVFQAAVFLKGASEWQVDAATTHYLLCVAPDSKGAQLLSFARLSAHRTEVAVVSDMRLAAVGENGSAAAKKGASANSTTERCTGLALHPSENYALVATSAGRVVVFHLQTGECRGVIRTPAAACGACAVDPSGLYLAVLFSAAASNKPGRASSAALSGSSSVSVLLGAGSLALNAPRGVLSLTASDEAAAAASFDRNNDSDLSAAVLGGGAGSGGKMSLDDMMPTALRLAGVSLSSSSSSSSSSVDASALTMTSSAAFTRVLLYEVGTGKYIDEYAQPQGVSHAAFTGNGQALLVASVTGM